MTRKSKIARLPRSVRDELNRRLDNGHPGIHLVEWLNSLPEVKEALARDFQGRRITPQNISEWKRGGYHDWLAQQEHAATLQDFLADAKELGDAASPEKLTEAVFNFALVHYAAATHRSFYHPEHRDHLNRCSQMLNDVIRLRNCDLAQQRFELDTQKLAFNAEKLEIQTELARLRLDLARQKVGPQLRETPDRSADIPVRSKINDQEARSLPNAEAAPPSPPRSGGEGRGEEALRAQGESSFDVRRSMFDVRCSQVHGATSLDVGSSMFVVGCSQNPLEINPLQPNPTKSNNPFFIFPQTTTAGQSYRLSPSSSSPTCHQKPPIIPKFPEPQHRNHVTRNTQHEPCTLKTTGVFHPLSPTGHT